MHNYILSKSTSKEARIYHGEKTTTLINGVGKTGQLDAKE